MTWHEHQRRIIDALPPLTEEQNRAITRVVMRSEARRRMEERHAA